MEAPVFNLDTFNQTVEVIRQLGSEHESKNQAALERHNKAYFEYGGEISSQMPDTASVDNFQQVGKAMVNLVGTIPGVSTEGMLEVVSNPDSLALSNRAISARLRYSKGTEIGAYLNLDTNVENFGRELYFDRIDPKKSYFRIELRMDTDGVPKNGRVLLGKSFGGGGVSVGNTIDFDVDGRVEKDYSPAGLSKGDKINVVKIIQQVTSQNGMDQPIDADSIIRNSLDAKLPEKV